MILNNYRSIRYMKYVFVVYALGVMNVGIFLFIRFRMI
jgi:hypothetical protein